MRSTYSAIDLHLDSFIWQRIFGYDFLKRHRPNLAKGYFFGQVDLPRLAEAGFQGAVWAITTNPLRTNLGRARAFEKNIQQFLRIINESADRLKLISSFSDYKIAQNSSQHATWLAVQGANAFGDDLNLLSRFAEKLCAVTLMHLTHSSLGTSATPYPSSQKKGLTKLGHEFIERLNFHRVFVDLAHADPKTFQDAVEAHDHSQPLIVTHTGVNGVYPHWRNLSDEQIKQVASSGGVIGILFHRSYLGNKKSGQALAIDSVVAHLEHIQKVAGDDFTALGSDWDGMIIPTRGLRDSSEFPNLIRAMEKRRWSTTQIEKTLSQNFLRAYAELRPT